MLFQRLMLFVLLFAFGWNVFIQSPSNLSAQSGPSPAAVEDAIKKSVAYLYREQRVNGSWPGFEQEYGCGATALIVLSLLSAGERPTDPRLQKAIKLIRRTNPKRTYEIALHCMVLCMAEPSKDLGAIEKDVDALLSIQSSNGGWGYDLINTTPDESNSQFAVLALWEASKLGIVVPDEKIQKALQYWKSTFLGTGWGYRDTRGTSGAMTCAGIASVLILRDATDAVDAKIVNGQLRCCGSIGNEKEKNQVDAALEWLGNRFSVSSNPGSDGTWAMYYLYALERVGRLTGQRFIGETDWYRAGSEHLIRLQDESGKMRGALLEDGPIATAMGLLFLSKGKRQVVIGHLQHGDDRDWNLHRRSIQNLTGNVEKVWKRELAWQSIKLQNATVGALLETPVLFISGSKTFRLTEPQRKMLRDYVEQGGLIFAEACNGDGCNGQAFDDSFRLEMEKTFDKAFAKLAPTHAVWSAEATIDPTVMPDGFWMYGIDFCCKTSVIYSPISLSCRWELARPWGKSKIANESINKDVENAVKLGVNVVAYATGRELKDKLQAVDLIATPTNYQSLQRGNLKLAKIQHAGGADDASRSVLNLMKVYSDKTKSLVELDVPLISLADKELGKFPLLYIHGRNQFVFSEAERKGLKKHFETGGFVIGDAVCASKEFAKAMRDEFSKALPEAKWKTLDVGHSLMTKDQPDAFEGFDITNVTLVDPTISGADIRKAKRQGPPEIDALEWNGKIVALFSPNDLSCAMESKHSMQCKGYVRDDSFKIAINMLLYGLSN